MKKLFIMFIAVISISTSFAQTKKTQALIDEINGQWSTDENKNLFYQKIIELPGINKETLYQRAENYFIYNYNSGKDVIQTKDKEQGLIIGKGLWPDFYVGIILGTMSFSANHILRVDLKDEKARITLTVQKFDCVYNDGKSRNEFSTSIASIYPINTESKSKTMEGKAFYAVHNKCLSTIYELTNSLKNDAIKETIKTDW